MVRRHIVRSASMRSARRRSPLRGVRSLCRGMRKPIKPVVFQGIELSYGFLSCRYGYSRLSVLYRNYK